MSDYSIPSLRKYAYLGNFDVAIKELADMARPERWDYVETPDAKKNIILENYIYHTFDRLLALRKAVPASRSSSSNTVEHHILCSLQVYSAWKTGCAAEVHSHRTFRTPVLFYVLSVSVQVHESRRFPERSVPAPCFFLPFYKFLLHRHQKIIQFTLNFISAWNCTNHRIFYDLARFHHITNCNALNPFTPI